MHFFYTFYLDLISWPVQFKRVGTVAVCGLFLQVARQVDDSQSTKWTFLQKWEKSLNIYCTFYHFFLIHYIWTGSQNSAAVTQIKMFCTQSHSHILITLHTLMQIAHPIQSDSDIHTILLWLVTSIHSLPAKHYSQLDQRVARTV